MNIDISDDLAIDLSRNMRYADRALTLAVSAELARLGLLPTEFEVLRMLDGSVGGVLRTGELAGPATTTVSGVSRLIDRLLAEQLVTRSSGAGDRRVQEVAITGAGRDRLIQARRAYRDAVERVLREAGLESSAAYTLSALLAHLGKAE